MINVLCSAYIYIYIYKCVSSSLLSIVSDGDISVGFRPLCALLVGERIDQFEI